MSSVARQCPSRLRQPAGSLLLAGLVWGLLCLLGTSAEARQSSGEPPVEKTPLRVDLLQTVVPRSEGPVPIQVTLTPSAPVLFEGRLIFTLRVGGEFLGQLETEDLAIPRDGQTMRWILPSPDLHGPYPQIDVIITVVHQGQAYELNPRPLRVPSPAVRNFVVGQVTPPTTTHSKELEELLETLKFEQYSGINAGQKSEETSLDRSVMTTIARVMTSDLPGDPLGYCAFNVMVCADDGFSSLRESQIEPLERWVRAGGSLLVIPRGTLEGWHVNWLNKILKGIASESLVAGPDGMLLPPAAGNNALYRKTHGLGRIAVLHVAPKTPVKQDSREWRETLAHVWNLRAEQTTGFVQSGRWEKSLLQRDQKLMEQQNVGFNSYAYGYSHVRPQNSPLIYSPISSGDEIINRILPSNLQLVPISLIALLLFVYVLMIGPLEYVILGKFRIRKWTWVTFPLTTFLFTFGAFQLTDFYMNVGDNRREVIVLDAGPDGELCRANRLQLIFNSRQRVVETKLGKSLFSPINHQMIGTGAWRNYNSAMSGGRDPSFVGPAESTGRIPTQFAARQRIPQWTPQLNRVFTLQTEDYKLPEKFDWNQFSQGPIEVSSGTFDRGIVDRIKASVGEHFGSDARAMILQGNRQLLILGEMGIFESETSKKQREEEARRYGQAIRTTVSNSQAQTPPANDFLSDITMLRDAGLFSIVSQLAPHGGRQLEDLSILDPSNTANWVLVIAVPRQDNLLVYRKLYRGTAP